MGIGMTNMAPNPQPASESIARAAKSHDGLCIIQTGMSCCWCMCANCWGSGGRTILFQIRGRCICRECPCKSLELSTSPVLGRDSVKVPILVIEVGDDAAA